MSYASQLRVEARLHSSEAALLVVKTFFFGLHLNFGRNTALIFPFRNHLGSHCPPKILVVSQKFRSGNVPGLPGW